jgi:CMP-N,N'-diacetyllegionaminic acid synthase
MSVIGIIPARGGSKGIPRKNITSCAGQPLISYTAQAALGSKYLTRTLVSTDDSETADVCRKLGIEVPFTRPASFAQDESPMIDVLLHALDWLEKTGEKVEALVLLQPTSPLRQSHHIDAAVDLFRSSGAETVVSVVKVPHQFHPTSLLQMEAGGVTPLQKGEPLLTRRQDKSILFARNGPAILILKPTVLRRKELYGNPTVGYEMSTLESVDVDGLDDLRLANALLSGESPQ